MGLRPTHCDCKRVGAIVDDAGGVFFVLSQESEPLFGRIWVIRRLNSPQHRLCLMRIVWKLFHKFRSSVVQRFFLPLLPLRSRLRLAEPNRNLRSKIRVGRKDGAQFSRPVF